MKAFPWHTDLYRHLLLSIIASSMPSEPSEPLSFTVTYYRNADSPSNCDPTSPATSLPTPSGQPQHRHPTNTSNQPGTFERQPSPSNNSTNALPSSSTRNFFRTKTRKCSTDQKDCCFTGPPQRAPNDSEADRGHVSGYYDIV